MNDTRIPCPYCGQDWLRRVRVRATGEIIRFCGECESVRINEDETLDTIFDRYAKAHGIPPFLDELEQLE